MLSKKKQLHVNTAFFWHTEHKIQLVGKNKLKNPYGHIIFYGDEPETQSLKK